MKILQNTFNKINSNKLGVLKLCYLFVFIVIVIFNLLNCIYNYINLEHLEMTVNDFSHVGVEVVDDYTIITETDDTQFIYQSDKPILNLYFKADTLFNVGEWVLFYQNDLDKEFSADKKLYAKHDGEGYYFQIPLNTKKIRFDLGVTASNTITFNELTVNKSSLFAINAFQRDDLFSIFVLPLVLFSAILLCNDAYLFLNKIIKPRRS